MKRKKEIDVLGLSILAAMYLIAAVVVSAEVYTTVTARYEDRIEVLHTQLENRNDTIGDLKEHREVNTKYANLIQQITETLVTNDEEYGLGGVGEDTVIYDNEELLEAILSDLHTRSPDEWINNVGRFYENREDTLSDLPDIWPVIESEFDRVTSSFGLRYSPIDERVHYHEGIDLTTDPSFGAILATAPGTVSGVWEKHPRYGRIVYIEHANGFSTRYAHMSRISVRYGEEVDKGQVIGYIGGSGLSDGVHLHYEIRKNGEPIDPVQFMLIK